MNEFVTSGWVRRVGAAALAVVVGFGLTGCRARGGGNLPPGPDVVGVFEANATFGFNLTCELDSKGRPIVRGQISYHDHGSSEVQPVDEFGVPIGDPVGFPEIAIHGELDPMIVNATTCEAEDLANMVEEAAQFVGRYRPDSLDSGLGSLTAGKFNVLLFDEGEPGRTKDGFTGDYFSIELIGGRFNGYTRGGYIEGGNIQVE